MPFFNQNDLSIDVYDNYDLKDIPVILSVSTSFVLLVSFFNIPVFLIIITQFIIFWQSVDIKDVTIANCEIIDTTPGKFIIIFLNYIF